MIVIGIEAGPRLRLGDNIVDELEARSAEINGKAGILGRRDDVFKAVLSGIAETLGEGFLNGGQQSNKTEVPDRGA